MTRIKIDRDVLLPDVDDNDRCVLQLISDLKDVDGIELIYVIPDIGGAKAQFCSTTILH